MNMEEVRKGGREAENGERVDESNEGGFGGGLVQ